MRADEHGRDTAAPALQRGPLAAGAVGRSEQSSLLDCAKYLKVCFGSRHVVAHLALAHKMDSAEPALLYQVFVDGVEALAAPCLCPS